MSVQPSGISSHSASTGDVTGIVLAGGEGRRVNGADKGLLSWQGKPLVEHVVESLRPQVTSLLLSCNRNVDEYRRLGQTVTDSRTPNQGPLAGIEAAAPFVDTPFTAICPCDTPNIPPALVPKLLASLVNTDHGVAYAHDGLRDHYLCAVIRSTYLANCSVQLDMGQRSVKRWYEQIGAIAVSFDEPEAFANHNDLDAIAGE